MKIYSVTEINNHIKLLFMKDSVLSGVQICGEISNCKYHSSGHIYFTIKDSGGQLSCVMFAGKRSGLNFTLEEGLNVVVSGTVTVYERDGKYQLYADRIVKQGLGELYERFEALKNKLLQEGLFEASHKKPIPEFISVLGVITAETGAALQDILNITHRRNPYVKVVLYPAKVQGQGASETLVNGIHAMEKIKPDVIIIGRGGGSIEDLFEFNSENLARAIYDCSIPVISAVGHEVDFTICDYVSDLRAPTPSAAAELAVFEFDKFEARLVDYHYDLYQSFLSRLEKNREITEQYRLKLLRLSPENMLINYRHKNESYMNDIKHLFSDRLNECKRRLILCASELDNLSPLKSLARGYSYVTDSSGHNIKSIHDTKIDEILNIDFTDGKISARVTDISDKGEV